MTIVVWFVWVLTLYAAIGLVFGAAFVMRGIATVHPEARGAGVAVRLILLPGAAALWPVLLRQWMR